VKGHLFPLTMGQTPWLHLPSPSMLWCHKGGKRKTKILKVAIDKMKGKYLVWEVSSCREWSTFVLCQASVEGPSTVSKAWQYSPSIRHRTSNERSSAIGVRNINTYNPLILTESQTILTQTNGLELPMRTDAKYIPKCYYTMYNGATSLTQVFKRAHLASS
jgi:hypothetical protein